MSRHGQVLSVHHLLGFLGIPSSLRHLRDCPMKRRSRLPYRPDLFAPRCCIDVGIIQDGRFLFPWSRT